ncbi:hypothetical protein DJ568_13620 [Mucilaginibacter hurinus]|uniref:Uncharacterized protein n=1 Tax=Mucilaginibacter hurinus TaxID=2201324 RepID=A0A367GMR7_9SPHI|nr:hypothetical protein [Mucilaginibacter hurinus]RCH54325.1 hypothetical protein DJ568_13620 [Mucilaginibacter hurinus]
MKKWLSVTLLAVIIAACNKKDSSDCGNKTCTLDFRMVTVKFLNKDGEGINVKNYSAVNQRTKDTINFPPNAHVLLQKGTYIVISDSYTKSLPESGDDIKVTGTDSVTNETKTAIFKVAGGRCACHINKLSGPEEIRFDN